MAKKKAATRKTSSRAKKKSGGPVGATPAVHTPKLEPVNPGEPSANTNSNTGEGVYACSCPGQPVVLFHTDGSKSCDDIEKQYLSHLGVNRLADGAQVSVGKVERSEFDPDQEVVELD